MTTFPESLHFFNVQLSLMLIYLFLSMDTDLIVNILINVRLIFFEVI